MNDVMIDLETLGTGAQSPIIAIGACGFNRKTGEIGETFEVKIDFSSAIHGRTLTGGTLKWWFGQDEEARKSVTSGSVESVQGYKSFVEWVRRNFITRNVKVWGNGSSFDITILENFAEQFALDTPWKFWNVRDVRTIVDLASEFSISPKDFEFEGVKHSALADAKHQVKYVSEMIKVLTPSGPEPSYNVNGVVHTRSALVDAGYTDAHFATMVKV